MRFVACLVLAAAPIPIALVAYFVREAATASGDMRFLAILVAWMGMLVSAAVLGIGIAMWNG